MPKKKSSIRVESRDLWLMLLSTIRYSMGRATYITGLCREMYNQYSSILSPEQRLQIAEEIERELIRALGAGTTLGMDIDHQSWTEMAAAIREEFTNV